MQLKSALIDAITRLTLAQVPSPRMNAELLLMFTLGSDRAYLHAHPEHELTADDQTRYDHALAERSRGVPAQYITGHQEFWGMDLVVTPAVLIPRPETEHLIETVLELAAISAAERSKNAAHSLPRASRGGVSGGNNAERKLAPEERKSVAVRIADVGTGSGCIALALAKEIPQAQILATDISAAALEVARANAARHHLESRIEFRETDLLTGSADNTFEFIVSNPPYVGDSETDTVQLEVRKFEPRNAVFAGPAGTEVIARLIPQAHAALKPGGWLIMEVSGTIAEEVERMLKEWDNVLISPDLQSIPRVARARK